MPSLAVAGVLSWRDILRSPAEFAPESEGAFWADYCKRLAAHRRVSVVFAAMGWGAYLGWDVLLGMLDPLIAPIALHLATIRATGFLLMLFLLAASRGERFASDERFASKALMGGCWSMFFTSYLLMWLAPFPYNYLYYFFGVLMIMVFAAGPLHLRARDVTRFMLLSSVANFVYVIWRFVTVPPPELVSELVYPWASCAFLLTIAVVGVMVGVQYEHSERLAFQRQRELEDSHEVVSRRNREVERLVDDIRASREESEARWADLLSLKEELRVAAELRDHEKSVFLAKAVHDLRQPVQAIGNVLEPVVSALERKDTATAGQLVQLARRAVGVMRHQLSAILDLSRLESGVVKPEIGPANLQEAFLLAVAEAGPLAARQRVDLRKSWELPPHIAAQTDARFLSQILVNLLSNAVKFHAQLANRASWVLLSARQKEDQLEISVQDNGQGIPSHLLESGAIFKPFAQYNNQQPESDKGVGLGLAIVKSMINLLPGHELKIKSEVGVGSTFTLLLPLGTPEVGGMKEALPFRVAVYSGLYVLLVEDDDLVRRSTAWLLESQGMIVEAADSFESAEQILQSMERFPDVVVSDYRLPRNRTAVDVVRSAATRFGSIPLVVFSGESMDFTEVESLSGSRVLRKPVPAQDLLAAIEAATRKP